MVAELVLEPPSQTCQAEKRVLLAGGRGSGLPVWLEIEKICSGNAAAEGAANLYINSSQVHGRLLNRTHKGGYSKDSNSWKVDKS